MTELDPTSAFNQLHNSLQGYFPISPTTWQALQKACTLKRVDKGTHLYSLGETPHHFAYIVTGLFRVFISDEQGNEYNKNFFEQGQFPGTMAALLTNTPSKFSVEALEDSVVITIDFKTFRQQLTQHHDLALFHIHYLEQNWLLAKEPREVALVQDEARQRYVQFLKDHPSLAERIPQFHIASHLGITPTQLSRIRKSLHDQSL